MHVLAQAFWLPKAGNSASEYEDAVWPSKPVDRGLDAFTCAVADGATETSYSRLWSELLVRAYCKGGFCARRHRKVLPELQRKWLEQVTMTPMPWYAEEKVRMGAFSAIAGLTVRANGVRGLRWEATAIGDSCVFQVRDGRLLTALPLQTSD
jgi:hypothetical protein